jgi:hypothetical protein
MPNFHAAASLLSNGKVAPALSLVVDHESRLPPVRERRANARAVREASHKFLQEGAQTRLGTDVQRHQVEPTSDHEAWLVNLILSRFEQYAISPTQTLMDELYVLIGALKIAGLDVSHESMKSRLLAISRTDSNSGSD